MTPGIFAHIRTRHPGREVRVQLETGGPWFDAVVLSPQPLRVRITTPDPVWFGAETHVCRCLVKTRKGGEA